MNNLLSFKRNIDIYENEGTIPSFGLGITSLRQTVDVHGVDLALDAPTLTSGATVIRIIINVIK